MGAIPRLVISAPSSGHGKTAVSVGLLAAFAARGLRATGFKVGPDYVDAAYLGLAAGRPGRNLDPRLVGAGRIGPLFAHGAAGAEISVVEGTMGLFDGLTSRTDGESTAQIAGLLRAPVILVVDVGAMGQSAAAVVHGFRSYDELLWLGGVVLTRVMSSRHDQLLRESLADIGVPVLGSIRRSDLATLGPGGSALPPREHGLAPAVQRGLEALRGVRRLGELITASVDLDRVLVLARSAPQISAEPWSPEGALVDALPTGDLARPRVYSRRPLIAVASRYGYPETAELIRAAGADVVAFDPLRDERLPEGTDGLVVPGGLPESYADQLSANERLREEVRALARSGRPVVAEGAGLVWLMRELDGRPMCGVLDGTARSADRYVVGYREATAAADSILHRRGATVTGHKLHRTLVTPRAGTRAAWQWAGGHPEGYVQGAIHASYLSVHWAGAPQIATRLVAASVGSGAEPQAAIGAASAWSTADHSGYMRPKELPAGGDGSDGSDGMSTEEIVAARASDDGGRPVLTKEPASVATDSSAHPASAAHPAPAYSTPTARSAVIHAAPPHPVPVEDHSPVGSSAHAASPVGLAQTHPGMTPASGRASGLAAVERSTPPIGTAATGAHTGWPELPSVASLAVPGEGRASASGSTAPPDVETRAGSAPAAASASPAGSAAASTSQAGPVTAEPSAAAQHDGGSASGDSGSAPAARPHVEEAVPAPHADTAQPAPAAEPSAPGTGAPHADTAQPPAAEPSAPGTDASHADTAQPAPAAEPSAPGTDAPHTSDGAVSTTTTPARTTPTPGADPDARTRPVADEASTTDTPDTPPRPRPVDTP
jgi:cobyrinic acid a,c-diamide synthase